MRGAALTIFRKELLEIARDRKAIVFTIVLPVLIYPKTESGARDLFELYKGLVKITLAACLVFISARRR